MVGPAGRPRVAVRQLVRHRLDGARRPDAAADSRRPARVVPRRPASGGRRRAGRRADAQVLRPRAAAAAGDGAAADARPARVPALPAGLVAGRLDRAELAAVLQRHLADRSPGRGAGRVRRDPRGHRPAGGRGAGGRPPHRSSGRAGRPARLPGQARVRDRRRLGGGGEDPRSGRDAAGRLGLRGDDRVRRAQADRRALPRPGRRRAAHRRVRAVHPAGGRRPGCPAVLRTSRWRPSERSPPGRWRPR